MGAAPDGAAVTERCAGVHHLKRDGRWRAQLTHRGRIYRLGEYTTEQDAVAARKAAELAILGAPKRPPGIEIDGDIARVPLTARDGSIRAYALIDAADAPLAAGRRWCMTASGYAISRIDGRIQYLHRLVLPGNGQADHISGDRLDSRRANLRLCTQQENLRNKRKAKLSSAGYRGVCFQAGRFSASIMDKRVSYYLGRFDTAEEAARAYDAAARKRFGEFAALNFPDDP